MPWSEKKKLEYIAKERSKAFKLTEKDMVIVNDMHEWNIWRIKIMESGSVPYDYIPQWRSLNSYLRSTIYLNIKFHVFMNLWQTKVCENCGKPIKTLLLFKNPCALCRAPFDFKKNEMENWINGSM